MTLTLDHTINFSAPSHEPQLVFITPQYAKELLALNVRNRPVNSNHVASLQRQMLAGLFVYNGETGPKFSTTASGRMLLDGQQRMHALAGLEGQIDGLPFLVVTSLPPESQFSMDQGKKRGPGQQLSLLGYKDSFGLAASVSALIAWENGSLVARINPSKGRYSASTAEVEQWLAENADLYEKVAKVHGQVRTAGYGQFGGAFVFAAYRANPEKAEEFFHSLLTMEGLPAKSPILALTFRLRRMKATKERPYPKNILGYWIQCWNHWMDERPLAHSYIPRSGWGENNFPTLLTEPTSQPEVDAA